MTQNSHLVHKIEIQKKINKRVSTRESPCVEYEYNTCQNIEANKLVLDQFSCQIPILYFGHHLNNLIPNKTPNCNENVTKMAFKLLRKKGKNNETECSKAQTCKNIRYTATHTSHLKAFEEINNTMVNNPIKLPISLHIK